MLCRRAEYLVLNKRRKIRTDFRLCKILMRIYLELHMTLKKWNVGTHSFPLPWQGLQILLMSGVSVTSAWQILESFWNIWSQLSRQKKPFSDFLACGPGMNTLSWGIHEVAVVVHWPGKLKSMTVIEETVNFDRNFSTLLQYNSLISMI